MDVVALIEARHGREAVRGQEELVSVRSKQVSPNSRRVPPAAIKEMVVKVDGLLVLLRRLIRTFQSWYLWVRVSESPP